MKEITKNNLKCFVENNRKKLYIKIKWKYKNLEEVEPIFHKAEEDLRKYYFENTIGVAGLFITGDEIYSDYVSNGYKGI